MRISQDLDVDFRLQLKDELYNKLMRQIKADAALLERMRVMDYSLLLGIHYLEDPDAGADPLEQVPALLTHQPYHLLTVKHRWRVCQLCRRQTGGPLHNPARRHSCVPC